MKERIQKVLANYGVDSRRNIELMVQQGRIAVNGKVVTRLPILIDPEVDHVTVDDEAVRLATSRRGKKPVQKMYFLLNKPKGVYSTNVAQGEQKLARDLLPHDLPSRIYPVGRLDADSKGLLLMTNDGELTNLLTHPRFEVPKTYRAVIDSSVNEADLQKLQKGIWLADKEGEGFKTGASRVKVIHRGRQSILEITIREGRNRQVRRMLAKLGYKVRELMRIKMGPLTLMGVGVGKFRPLTPKEVRDLYTMAKRAEKRANERPQATTSRPEPPTRPDADEAGDFEDEELRREAAEEAGGPPPKPAGRGRGGAVEFVDLSDDEQAELESEAKAEIARSREVEEAEWQSDADPADDDEDFASEDETPSVDEDEDDNLPT